MYDWYDWDDEFPDCGYHHLEDEYEYCPDCCLFQGELQRWDGECDSCKFYELCEEAKLVLDSIFDNTGEEMDEDQEF